MSLITNRRLTVKKEFFLMITGKGNAYIKRNKDQETINIL